jgi:uncharacterized membrane protein
MKRELSYRLVLAAAAGTAVLALTPAIENLAGGIGIFSVIARLAFHPFCHQDPARSLVIAGALLPVCARCTGIYLGFLAGWSLRMFKRGPTRDRRLPAVFLLTGIAPLVIDGFANWVGIFNTPPAARLVTGLLFGIAAARALWPELLPALAAVKLTRSAPARAAAGQ